MQGHALALNYHVKNNNSNEPPHWSEARECETRQMHSKFLALMKFASSDIL
jgi:hypothetical protein